MKNILFLFILLFCISELQGQSLIEVYKKGSIELIPDNKYAADTDWNTLFSDRNQIKNGNPIGKMKSISVSQNGELFVGNYSNYKIYKFDNHGNFIKEFGKEGRKESEFLYRPTLQGILDNKFVFTSDHHGRILFFDLNGNFKKMVKIDYMPLQIIPLKDNKIAIWGNVAYKGDTKYIVSIKDINTGKEKIVDSYFNSLIKLKPLIVKDKNGYLYGFSPSGVKDKTIIERTFDGNLIIGHNVESTLSLFSPYGDLIKTIDLHKSPIKTTEKDKEKFLKTAKDYLIKKDLYEENKALLNDPKIYPETYPIFYAIKTDPEDNILIFNYSEEEGNSFLVFDKKGTFICESKLNSDNLKLDINSRFSTFEISANGLYAFVKVIDSKTSEIKIIKTLLK
ncbi:MAG: hypothetical protein JEY96_07755 [Bacteroidales bacterium]|nr:hypothetical protein [Bacteroidales bacterium]